MTNVTQEVSAHERWHQLLQAAGFASERELERALEVSEKLTWHWVNRANEPNLRTMRKMKQLLGVSLDTLDETIVSMRKEAAATKSAATMPAGGGPPG
jgi:adenylate cyclase